VRSSPTLHWSVGKAVTEPLSRPAQLVKIFRGYLSDPEATYQKVTQRLEKYRKQQAEISREVKQITSGGLAAAREDANPVEKSLADPQAPGQEEKPPASLPEQKTRLREALSLYQEGEFELARASLEQVLEKGSLTLEDELQARFSLASALVALEKPKEAEHEFVRLLMLKPDFEPDPVNTSPKVMEIFRRAGGGK
jgi:TolA-binding protein